MEPIILEPDEENTTPRVVLDKQNNNFEIIGNSLPEDILAFYGPIMNWVKDYAKQPNSNTTFKLKPNYFNSASFKAVLDLLSIFEKLSGEGHPVKIEWHYLEMDDDLLMTGKEFQSLVKLPFEFIPFME